MPAAPHHKEPLGELGSAAVLSSKTLGYNPVNFEFYFYQPFALLGKTILSEPQFPPQ